VQFHHTVHRRPSRPGKQSRTIEAVIGSEEAIAEINAYIAIRDGLLVEAEQIRTRAKIDSVTVANDFVMTCLKPARPPYEAQCLPEADAVSERKRCDYVRARIAELTAQIAARPSSRRCASIR
jgi:hypothetical protein